MLIGCNTVEFRHLSLDESLERIRRAGYEYVEVEANLSWCNHADPHNQDPVKFRQKVLGYGFKGISAIGDHRELLQDPQALTDLEAALKWCREAGIPVVITGEGTLPDGMTEEEALPLLKQRLVRLERVARENEIILAMEPHGQISLKPGGLAKVMSLVPSPWIGVNFDTANPHRADYVGTDHGGYRWRIKDLAKGDEVACLQSVADLVRHVHAKDVVGKRAVTLGRGEIRLKELLRIMHAAGFAGVLSVETEGEDTPEETQEIIAESRAYLIQALAEL